VRVCTGIVASSRWEGGWKVPTVRDLDLSWFLFFTEEAGHPVVAPDVDSGMPSDAALLDAYEAAAAMALIAKHASRRGHPDSLARMAAILPALIADGHRRVA
jgi:hypothetical protein